VIRPHCPIRSVHTAEANPSAFGHGLSYTSFEWTEAKITSISTSHEISLKVHNTGACAGQDVIQVYLSKGTEESRKLEAFVKTGLIQPGQSEVVKATLDRRAFERWDESLNAWKVQSGTWRIGLCQNVRQEVAGFDVTM
jgi:beta-glucosidase